MIPLISEWGGKLPVRDKYFFAAADHTYFLAFGPEFAMSAHEKSNPLHLHVFNPTPEAIETATFCNALSPFVTVSWFDAHDDPSLRGLTGKTRSAYCSNVRHHVMPQLLGLPTTQRVYGVDADSVFNRPFDMDGPSPLPLGLFLRDTWTFDPKMTEDERSRMMCLASMWWIDKPLIDYARAVSDYLRTRDLKWMLDQEALYVSMQTMRLRAACYDIYATPHLLDWKFLPQGVVWTGKGVLKNKDPRLIARRIVLKEQYLNLGGPMRKTKPQETKL